MASNEHARREIDQQRNHRMVVPTERSVRTSPAAPLDLSLSVRYAEGPVPLHGRQRVHVPEGRSSRLVPKRRGHTCLQHPSTRAAAEGARGAPRPRRRWRLPGRPWRTDRPEDVGTSGVRSIRRNDPLRRRDGSAHPSVKVHTVRRRPSTPRTVSPTQPGRASQASSGYRPVAWPHTLDQPPHLLLDAGPTT